MIVIPSEMYLQFRCKYDNGDDDYGNNDSGLKTAAEIHIPVCLCWRCHYRHRRRVDACGGVGIARMASH